MCHAVIAQQTETASTKTTFFFLIPLSVPTNRGATAKQRFGNLFEKAHKAPEYQEDVLSSKPGDPVQCPGLLSKRCGVKDACSSFHVPAGADRKNECFTGGKAGTFPYDEPAPRG